MSVERTRRALELFERVQELDAAARQAFLARSCVDDEGLRREVERMLAAEGAPGFLEPEAAPAPGGGAAHPCAGRAVGPFRLRRALGSGGMGVVFEAEQTYPRRRVALKMLRSDFAFARRGSERRFRAEVELLARLDHPGIARMLEAGVCSVEGSGEQPYFAMEFVEGARDLFDWGRGRPLRGRLALFASVCDAVHHGHQRGVVHRDLKPANVLVGSDGRAKVIDFGIARALDEGADATRATRTGDIVGTLPFLAPEQLEGDGRDVDTRTDVYALGLLLYRLVAGRAPYDLAGKTLAQVASVIREEIPVPLHALDPEVPSDLGWIAQRALEKEPGQRYGSVSELAADLRRFLDHRPVEAGPPSRLYVLRKFVRRNRMAVAAGAAVALALAGGGAVSFVAMLRAGDEADKFRSTNALLTEMFVSVRAEEGGHDVRAAELLDGAAERLASLSGRPELEAPLRRTLAVSYVSLGLFPEAEEQARRALALRAGLTPDQELEVVHCLARALLRQDRFDEARTVLARERPSEEEGLDPAGPLRLVQLEARLTLEEGRPADALRRAEALAGEACAALGPQAEVSLELDALRADALVELDRFGEAEEVAREVVDRRTRRDGEEAARTLVARRRLAGVLARRDELARAGALLEDLVPRFVDLYGEGHPRTLAVLQELADVYRRRGDDARALPILEEVVRAHEAREGPRHSATLAAKTRLARVLAELGDERGEELLREGLSIRREVLGSDHPRTLGAQLALGQFLRQAGRYEEAEAVLADVVERGRRVWVDDDLALHESVAGLGMLYDATGRSAEAVELLEDAWRGYQRRAGPYEATTLVIGNNYAGALANLERWDEAVLAFSEVLAGMHRGLAPDDPRLYTATFNLAVSHVRRGERARGRALLREALEWAREHFPEDDPRRIDACENLGFDLMKEGRAEEALPLYEEALRAADLNVAVPPNQQSAYRLGYARCLSAAGRPRAAAREYELVLEMERARLGSGHEEWFATLREELASVRGEAAPTEAAD